MKATKKQMPALVLMVAAFSAVLEGKKQDYSTARPPHTNA